MANTQRVALYSPEDMEALLGAMVDQARVPHGYIHRFQPEVAYSEGIIGGIMAGVKRRVGKTGMDPMDKQHPGGIQEARETLCASQEIEHVFPQFAVEGMYTEDITFGKEKFRRLWRAPDPLDSDAIRSSMVYGNYDVQTHSVDNTANNTKIITVQEAFDIYMPPNKFFNTSGKTSLDIATHDPSKKEVERQYPSNPSAQYIWTYAPDAQDRNVMRMIKREQDKNGKKLAIVEQIRTERKDGDTLTFVSQCVDPDLANIETHARSFRTVVNFDDRGNPVDADIYRNALGAQKHTVHYTYV